MDESGEFKVDKPEYVTDKTIELVGPKFWNKETRIIHLGSDGLRLTVVKSGQRQKIQHLDEVKKIRNIKDGYEEGKVVLQVRFDGSHWIPLKVLVDQVGNTPRSFFSCLTNEMLTKRISSPFSVKISHSDPTLYNIADLQLW